jgi:hypothetical protein
MVRINAGFNITESMSQGSTPFGSRGSLASSSPEFHMPPLRGTEVAVATGL